MKLGLIGNPLGHSWSPQIHRILIKEDYQLWQLKEDELDDFFCRRDFDGINVTIPYKQTVMKYLDEIDPAAKETGAVNCIVNRGGILKGYNTDYSGLRDMLKGHGVNLQNGRTAILGSGGASKAAQTAAGFRHGLFI
jgi:shikimate dehydrogenase